MYMGEHTNATEKLHEIQNKGRTKGSLLDHIAIPVTAFFVATDLMTVHLYTESLFDERPEMAMLVAASIALLLDACPMVAGKLKGQLDDMLPRDQRATKRRISALLGTAVGRSCRPARGVPRRSGHSPQSCGLPASRANHCRCSWHRSAGCSR